MGFFYVDENIGTGGIEYATKQTGAMSALGAANIYPDVQAAITAGAADDDIICSANLHDASLSSQRDYGGGSSQPLTIMSVDSLNIENYMPGAKETTDTFGVDMRFDGKLSILGHTFTSKDLIIITFTGEMVNMTECELKLNVSSNYIDLAGAGGYLQLKDCTLDLNYDNSYLLIKGGSRVDMIGGSVIFTASGTGNYLTNTGFVYGGGILNLSGVDISSVEDYIIRRAGGDENNEDMISVRIDKCKINSNLISFNEETFKHQNHEILVTQSSSDSASAEYQYYWHTRGGTVQDQDDAGIHRDESTPYLLSGKKVSLSCVTNSDASIGIPFRFKFPTKVAKLSTTDSKLRIYFASTEVLDDSKLYAKMIYPDRTNPNEFNTINSLVTPANVPENPLRTPGTYTDDSGNSIWKDGASDLTGYNEYYMELDTSTDLGADCVPELIMYVTESSIEIYFDTTIDLVAS